MCGDARCTELRQSSGGARPCLLMPAAAGTVGWVGRGGDGRVGRGGDGRVDRGGDGRGGAVTGRGPSGEGDRDVRRRVASAGVTPAVDGGHQRH